MKYGPQSNHVTPYTTFANRILFTRRLVKAPDVWRPLARLLKVTWLALHLSITALQRYHLLDVVKIGAEICVWIAWASPCPGPQKAAMEVPSAPPAAAAKPGLGGCRATGRSMGPSFWVIC